MRTREVDGICPSCNGKKGHWGGSHFDQWIRCATCDGSGQKIVSK